MKDSVGLNLEGSFLDLRRHPRIRIEAPFACALGRKGFRSWWSQDEPELGVVFDVSMRGAKVVTEAQIKPGDRMTLSLNLPKQAAPMLVTTATVRWVMGPTVGLEFLDFSSEAEFRLRKFLSQVTGKASSSLLEKLPSLPAK
ncbi:MAG: PilZ domain-containing protein [Nitrospiraceae bacterium]